MKKIIEYQDDNELVAKLRTIIKEKSKKMSGPGDAYKVFEKHANDEKECFMVAILDGSHNIIDMQVVTVGLVNRTIVHPREVYRPALMMNAAAIIVSHNHPSGNLEPSPEDLEITQRLKEAGEVLGVKLLDHLIVSPNGFISMIEMGYMTF